MLQESHRDPWSPAKEILGNYNPRAEKDGVTLKEERITYWLSQGAKPSATVHNLLLAAGLIKGDKAGSVTISKKRRAKMDEKKAEAEAKAAEAKATEEAAAEAPAEEASVEAPEEKTEDTPAVEAEEKTEEAEAPAEDAPAEEKKEEGEKTDE